MNDTCVICGKVFAHISKHLRKSKSCSASLKQVTDQNRQQSELPDDVLQEIEFVIKADQLGFDLNDLVHPKWSWAGHWIHLPSETSLTEDLNVLDPYDSYCMDPHECGGQCAVNAPCLLCDHKRDVPSKMCASHKTQN